jgi:hypothetical protein
MMIAPALSAAKSWRSPNGLILPPNSDCAKLSWIKYPQNWQAVSMGDEEIQDSAAAESPAHKLVGLTLESDWKVIAKQLRPKESTGGKYSVCYRLEKDGQTASRRNFSASKQTVRRFAITKRRTNRKQRTSCNSFAPWVTKTLSISTSNNMKTPRRCDLDIMKSGSLRKRGDSLG